MSEKDLKRVRDVMTTELQTVDGLATIDAAMRQMKQHGVGSLVVARRNQDDEVGCWTWQTSVPCWPRTSPSTGCMSTKP